MKKLIFPFFVLILSLALIGGTLSYKRIVNASKRAELEAFLASDKTISTYSDGMGKYSLDPNEDGNFFYKPLNPIDGIYYYSKIKKPLSVTDTGSKTMIRLSEGLYILTLNDQFKKYEINAETFRINQLGKGVFLISNIKGDYRIYSFNSILKIDMLSGKIVKNTINLLPGLLLTYDPSLNDILKNADIIRVALIDGIKYVDQNNSSFVDSIVGKNDPNKNKFVGISIDDIKGRFQKYSKLYSDILSFNFEDISGFEFISKYSGLFQNSNKKDIYLKNMLSRQFIGILKDYEKSKSSNTKDGLVIDPTPITTTLDQMQESSEDLYEEGINLVKGYYYLSFFGTSLNGDETFTGKMGLNTIMSRIIPSMSSDDHFSALSDIMFSYGFTSLKKESLNMLLSSYVITLLNNKVMKESDFLDFSFFLTQFLIEGNDVSKYSFSLILNIIELFDNYLITIKEKDKKISTLSMQFFNLAKIIGKMNNLILNKYFMLENGKIVLKEAFRNQIGDEVTAKLDPDFLSYMNELIKVGTKEMTSKKPTFYKELTGKDQQIVGINENFSNLESKFSKLQTIYSIMSNYSSYNEKMKLDQKNRDTKEVVYEGENYNFNVEDAKEYMSQFNGTNISDLIVTNEKTMDKDKFYAINVPISTNIFRFKLNPVGHIISDIEIFGPSGEKIQSIVNNINLDDKQESYNKSLASEKDPIKRQKFEFSNFFINTFFNVDYGGNDYSTNQNPTSKTTESTDLSVFKQDKLIDGDFTYIKKIVDIPFSKIKVSIDNGAYIIKIDTTDISLSSDKRSYSAELSAGYIFTEHSFKNITLKIYNSGKDRIYMLDGNSVEITPTKINVKDFTKTMQSIGKYLDVIFANYTGGQNIKINLNSGTVSIDSSSFSVK